MARFLGGAFAGPLDIFEAKISNAALPKPPSRTVIERDPLN
jgi:hypothetical protein